MPAYTVSGTLALGPDPDFTVVRAWAAERGCSLDRGHSGHAPSSVRAAYSHAARV
ncbi:hypothetical protein [Streptomyces sp. NPDC050263]|uniref:hypothetical protein n=1 Tax=Streptomyces sp. NPDC050263 TaxID=3155037 RepID=UPI00343D4598